MRRKRGNTVHPLLSLLTMLLFCGCATMDYRGVQAQFEQAVQVDNGAGVSAFNETSVYTAPGYAEVLAQLTPDAIGKLDERLRPNAWLLRAFCQYRTGELQPARESARLGLAEPRLVPSSRDHILLLMIPGLVVDMDIEKGWKEKQRRLTPEQYAPIERDYKSVFELFSAAEQNIGAATPLSTQYYLYYQRWRVIQGWRTIINTIVIGDEGQSESARLAALDRARQYFGGTALKDEAAYQAGKIPEGQPLRNLINAQSR
ncbi:MAG: hypothetical protein M0036_08375 [Desulfobacteraceae bacterium]|nr:hypothetical protein [Desulfobacteraceae bacterium]